MTNTLEPRKEDYPIQPEIEKKFGTDEIFARVKSLDGEIILSVSSSSFAFTVGRRSSEFATKAFSTDAGKTFCPGVEYPKKLTADEIAKQVTRSLLTNTRHALFPSLGKVSDGKSEDYKARQKALVEGLLKIEPALHREEEDERELIDLAEKYEKFMTVNGTPADTESVGEAFFATLNLIGKIRAQFSADETTSL